MTTSLEEISALLNERQGAKGTVIAEMREIKDTYNGDVVVPLPEMDKNERPAVANLINIGLDETGMRIASTLPNIYYPPLRPGIQKSEDLATDRMRATQGWMDTNRMNLLQRKRARHLIGYSQSPIILRPNKKWGCSEWSIQDPLDTFAAPSHNPLQFVPDDCIFTHAKNLAWLRKHYPDVFDQILKLKDGTKSSDMFDIVEYVDDVETVMFAQSRMIEDTSRAYLTTGTKLVPMKRIPNRAGRVPVVIPERISLDRPLGQFDGQIGMYRQEARLTALSLIAIERNIFPDTYLVGRQGFTPKFVQGPHDGRTGKVNIVSSGDIEVKTVQPSQSTEMMIDRLERAQRMSGSTPADMTGEAASNVRTGKRGDSIMSATIDMNIQESQEILAASAQEEIKIAIAQSKAYFGNEKKSFYISGYKNKGDIAYVANDIFENDNVVITYSYAGTDANSFIVSVAQRKGAGMMSDETAMELDPMITDVQAEKARIDSEAAKTLVVAAFSQQAQAGTIPMADVARVGDLVATQKMSYMEAIIKVNAEMQARQATPAPAGAPETQIGMGNPGAGAEQPTAAPTGPASLQDLLGHLNGSQMQATSSLRGSPNIQMATKSAV